MSKTLTEWLVKPLLEGIDLDVEVGDTILMGRFKNKRVKVKSIDYNDKGDLLINGRPALKFRIQKQGKKLLPQKTTDKDSTSPDGDMKGVKKFTEAPRVPRKKGQHRNSSSHSDLYTDENPKGTIKGLKFATVEDAEKSVRKIKNSGKTHAHKIQAAVAMEQRAKEMGKKSQAAVYRKFINSMKKKTNEIDDSGQLEEKAKRDYKDEYKKFQSSKKAKKYRAELNKYNRQKGTYGNGDKKDASHKGGKIVGYEAQSKNRGRREKSRLKKEINENKITLNVPSDIKKIYKLFKKNGKQLYVVGGAVRDAILGKRPKDFDLATDAKPDEVLKIAKKGGMKTYEVGKQFGVVVVGGHEIATFRKDIGKGRRPKAVDFSDIQGDVKRRDLTINSLFFDIGRDEVVDLTGGLQDLKDKIIRTVGKAKERFDELPSAPRQTKITTFDAPQRPFTKPLMEQTSFDKVLSEPKRQSKKIDRSSFSSSFSGHNADYLDFDYDTAKGRAEIGGSRPDNFSNVTTDQGTTRKYFRAPNNLAQGDRNKQYLVERIKGTNDYNVKDPRKYVVGKDGKQYDYMSKNEFTRKPVLQGLASELYHNDGAMNPRMIPSNVDVPVLELQGDVSVTGSTTNVNPQSNPPTYTHGTPQGDIRGKAPVIIQKAFGWDKDPEAVGSNVYNAKNNANAKSSGMGFGDRVKYYTGKAGQQIRSVVGETGRQVVSKGIKYAGIGATLVGSGLATAELIQGKWDEMNLAQKIANVGIQAGGGFEIAGLMSMNPYLQAFGGLISLASGVAGAIGEYQAGEKQKEDAKATTETLNQEAQDLKQDNVSATAYGRQTTTGRFDATKGIGVASF